VVQQSRAVRKGRQRRPNEPSHMSFV
jgi:hypothetical protein